MDLGFSHEVSSESVVEPNQKELQLDLGASCWEVVVELVDLEQVVGVGILVLQLSPV